MVSLAIALFSFGQAPNLKLELETSQEIYSYKPGENQLMGVAGDDFYFLTFDQFSTDKEYIITKINANTNNKEEFTLLLPDSFSISDLSNRFQLMQYSNYRLFFPNYDGVYIFQRINNTFIFEKKIGLGMGFQKLAFLNDKTLILYDFYNYHPLENEDRIKVYALNWETEALTKLKSVETIKGIEFSHLVNSYISYYGGSIAIADPLEYKVSFYKITGDTMVFENQIYLKDELNASTVFDSLVLPNLPDRNNIKLQLEFLDSTFKANCGRRIEKIYFVDSTRFFISIINHCKRDEREIYLYTFERDEWKLTISNKTYKLDSEKLHADKAGLQYSTPIYFIGGHLFMLSYLQPKSIKKDKEFGYYLNSYRSCLNFILWAANLSFSLTSQLFLAP